MQSVVRVDSKQMCVKGCMVQLGQGYAIGNFGLTEPLVAIRYDMSGVDQSPFRQS